MFVSREACRSRCSSVATSVDRYARQSYRQSTRRPFARSPHRPLAPSLLPASALGAQRSVGLRPPVAEELPRVSHLSYLVQIQVRDYQLVVISRSLSDDLASRVAEV